MVIDLQTLVVIAVPTVTVVVWLVRLEGRLNVESARISSVAEDVRYIRRRIDDALNGRHE